MGLNLTCYMNIKVLLIIVASAMLTKIGLTELGYDGFLFIIIDNAIPIYLVVSIVIDVYDVGRLKIKCLAFDLLIAFLMYMGYWIGIVIVAYIFELIFGFFKYIIFS